MLKRPSHQGMYYLRTLTPSSNFQTKFSVQQRPDSRTSHLKHFTNRGHAENSSDEELFSPLIEKHRIVSMIPQNILHFTCPILISPNFLPKYPGFLENL